MTDHDRASLRRIRIMNVIELLALLVLAIAEVIANG